MITSACSSLKAGGLAILVTIASVGPSLAQSATSDIPSAGITAMEAIDFPSLGSVGTDAEVAAELVDQGYQNIVVVRTEDALVVAAERRGVPTEMVFSPVDGRLIMIDGVQPMPASPAGTGADGANP